jgi:carotenoid cleavage dioxygenase-like enzyme
MFSYGAKMFFRNHTLCLSSIQGGMQYHAGYIIPIRKGLTFGAHYKIEAENGSTTTFGLKQRAKNIDITGLVNTKGKLSTIFNVKDQLYGLKLTS